MSKLFLASLVSVSLGFSALSAAAENAGKTIMARGDVIAVDSSAQVQRDLKRRDPIFDIDKVVTNDNGRAQFSMVDGGLLSVKPNSEVMIASYQYDPSTKQGSAVIELVKGGLRSISGQIKKHGGDYQVKTPVGSIGIRGTHFELEMQNDELLIAVWDGAIDLTTSNDNGGTNIVSFGAGETFSYGRVSSTGAVTPLLEAPEAFEQGNSGQSSDEEDSTPSNTGESAELVLETQPDNSTETTDVSDTDTVYTEQQFLVAANDSLADILSSRTGQFTYGNVTQSAVNSTSGGVSNFGLSMTVDFDNGVVNNGELTATDSGGNWYAAFSGLINVTELDLAVTFAAHGNEKADGNIDAIFTNDGDSITGSFELIETLNPAVRLDGTFVVE